ncbi:unnamed protein product [Colletotrichum noveboracense]|uniref:NWD NACHT-NTPase N-terminal domain-containing protein n=1 Tax=Colletotrichum noveboracense TaxID=2664923 RepID=A0A9W4WHB4_9PEZI|nr:unnamed protein product [Colletotrichum noveboracense]
MAPSDTITPNLWDIARKRLTKTEEAQLAKAAVDNNTLSQQLLELVQGKKQQCMERRWKFKLSNGEVVVIRDLFEKIVRWLQKFKEVGDIAVQYDPVHAALPWAGVRMLLQVVVNDTETLGTIAEGLEIVSHLIARCALYEGIYLAPSTRLSQTIHVELVKALTALYTVILQWLSKAGTYYAMSAGKRFLSSTVSPAPTFTLIAEKERKVNYLAAAIQGELVWGTAQVVESLVTNSSSLFGLMQDLEQPILRVASVIDRLEIYMDARDRKRVGNWISEVHHQHAHKRVHHGVIDNTGGWLFRNKKYIDWCESECSSVLWLHGIPGCGKSKLASLVIQKHLQHLSQYFSTSRLAYCYCSRLVFDGTQLKPDPLVILGSILKQLATSEGSESVHQLLWEEFSSRSEQAEQDGSRPFPLSFEECQDFILAITSNNPVTIIVDGLDEADGDVRDLLNSFRHIVEESRETVKLFISCRDDMDTVPIHLQTEEIRITRQENSEDIRTFVQKMVTAAVDRKKLLQGKVSAKLRNRITNTLTHGAGEMFLWAYLHLEHLCSPSFALEADLNHELDALKVPPSLRSTLEKMYERVEGYPPVSRHIAKSIFGWLLISERRLSRSELLDITCLPHTIGEDDNICISSDEPIREEQIRNLCRGFISFDGDTRTLTFSHESIREFVRKLHGFDPSTLHQMAVSQCLKYLTKRYGDGEDTPPNSYRLMMPRVPKKACPSPDVEVRDSTLFWSYAVCYWPLHYTSIRGIYNRPQVEDEILEFVFDHHGLKLNKWLSDVPVSTQLEWHDGAERLSWAIELLKEVTGVGLTFNSSIFLASVYGIAGILERLAIENAHMDWDAKNNSGLSGTYLSAQYGRHDALRFLLSHGAAIGKTEGRFGTPIQAAAFHGHTETVRILLQYGADALASGQFSTALHAAIEGGHESVVDLLACEYSCYRQSDLRDLVKAASYNGYHTAIRALLRQHIQGQPSMSDTSQEISSRTRFHTHRHDSCLKSKEAISGSNDILQAALYGISGNELPLSVVDNISNINASGGLFGNALQAACFGGSAQWVHVLLEQGADPNSLGNAGSALRAASLGGHDAVVKLLLTRGAILGPDERDALEACALKDRLSTLKLLIAHFELKNITDYNECKRYFNAAMRTARREDRYRMVVFMVENGAGLLRRDLLKDAAKGGQEAITNFLRSTDTAPHLLLDIFINDSSNVLDRLVRY